MLKMNLNRRAPMKSLIKTAWKKSGHSQLTFLAHLVLLLLLPLTASYAQCPFTPSVVGDTLLCPNQTGGVLTTQEYESYQWYRRNFLSNDVELLPGENQQNLSYTAESLPAYFSVEVSQNACTRRSEEILVDGIFFLLPFVIQSGEYTFDGNTGVFTICQGDTLFLELGLPYDTNITWFKNGQPIPDQNTMLYPVTAAGSYTVEAAPRECPDFIQPLGLVLDVEERTCETNLSPILDPQEVQIFPNPTQGTAQLLSEKWPIQAARVFNSSGQLIQAIRWPAVEQQQLDLKDLPAGLYLLELSTAQGSYRKKLVKW